VSGVRVHPDAAALYAAAAEHVAEAAARAVAERGRFLLVMAGGSTPRGVYERLAGPVGERIPWQRVHLFWGDERCVSPDDPASNYGMAEASLLHAVPVPAKNLHRIHGEHGALGAAELYDAALAAFFGAARPTDPGARPAFDLVLLGVGTDGHTASLFPGSPALDADGWAAPAEAPPDAPVRERITLTLPALGSARECLFLVTGADKRQVVQRLLHAPGDAPRLPAARVRGQVFWFLDAASAADTGPPRSPASG
jgi:6-phosphogluconolactonase